MRSRAAVPSEWVLRKVAVGKTVLVVDDDADIRRMIARVLGRRGVHVLTAADAPAALALVLGATHIDVLVTDVMMPTVDGFELAAEVRRVRPETSVIFMSGGCREIPTSERFLSKPFSIAELCLAIVYALGVHESVSLPAVG